VGYPDCVTQEATFAFYYCNAAQAAQAKAKGAASHKQGPSLEHRLHFHDKGSKGRKSWSRLRQEWVTHGNRAKVHKLKMQK